MFCQGLYTISNKKSWKKGVVIEEVFGKIIYLVRILENDVVWKRHLDQLIKSGEELNYKHKQKEEQQRNNYGDYG